jgi:hypothetical protein
VFELNIFIEMTETDSVQDPPVASDSFHYEPLDIKRNQIRILELHPGLADTPLQCSLKTVSLSELPLYDALSYEWGQLVTEQIMLDGMPIEIRQNLFAALWHLRSEFETKVLWIDALCINQEDVVERGAQVSMMGEIYSHAIQVRVWLGQGSEDTQEAFALAHDISELLDINSILTQEQKDVLGRSQSSWVALAGIFSASYWSRVWIIQEFVLAQEVVVHCGKNKINWAYLEAILFQFQKQLYNPEEGIPWESIPPFLAERVNAGRRSGVQSESLMRLLQLFAVSKSTDPRDKVYALIGLSFDAKDNFVVDYAKDLEEVKRDVAVFNYSETAWQAWRTMRKFPTELAHILFTTLDNIQAQ